MFWPLIICVSIRSTIVAEMLKDDDPLLAHYDAYASQVESFVLPTVLRKLSDGYYA